MIKLGLTGGICSGKSTISSMIKEAGIPVIDADIIAREVLEKYPDILLRVRATFGGYFFDWRGDFRRREFGNHIFRFPKERIKYEEIIMPYIKEEIEIKLKEYEKINTKLVVVDGATLIENDMHKDMDMVVLVWVDKSSQIERMGFRDKLSKGEAINRINSQLSLERKKDYANIIIDNSGNLIKTKEQIDDLLEFFTLYQ
ncbi:dephospho-CoA kinase [Clostridium perfringens]|uniref:dephospho-CoA kinase n=1 Tax=Clostridium perfringens TaxID=1502 RepID=UPI000E504866|nr:dephospho-CoA kinase [Clostridium perfringens]MDK0717332.1 dephospho-CoA kinase [Clostridium perfringens]MDK0729391.1 dephospho-CoA kinase [Clostridium perfringens]MDK0737438.1 dephospho-CoA kinase [Clostridium perfringens]MDK0804300.1 dephospho-CoA kinase [Clostridium perfringens]MDM0546910.1 dephospho-CoA kinase [Clostridium perfringens]